MKLEMKKERVVKKGNMKIKVKKGKVKKGKKTWKKEVKKEKVTVQYR